MAVILPYGVCCGCRIGLPNLYEVDLNQAINEALVRLPRYVVTIPVNRQQASGEHAPDFANRISRALAEHLVTDHRFVRSLKSDEDLTIYEVVKP